MSQAQQPGQGHKKKLASVLYLGSLGQHTAAQRKLLPLCLSVAFTKITTGSSEASK